MCECETQTMRISERNRSIIDGMAQGTDDEMEKLWGIADRNAKVRSGAPVVTSGDHTSPEVTNKVKENKEERKLFFEFCHLVLIKLIRMPND